MKKATVDSASLARETIAAGILSATLSSPTRASSNGPPAKGGERFDRIKIRPVILKSGPMYQLEQFRETKVFHRNVDGETLEGLLAEWIPASFTRAEFTLTTGSVRILSNRRGETTVLRKSADKPDIEAAHGPESNTLQARDAGPASASRAPTVKIPEANAPHNRAKKYILEEGIPVPFLVDLGVMTSDGTVVKSKYDKFRQINRFLEFIADAVPELTNEGLREPGTTREFTVVDFGCGKSYLTFAVYHYLRVLRNIPTKIIGLDLKADVIEHCSGLALKYGYDTLGFEVGDIAGYAGLESADMVITLHACDTATDFALAQAVRWNARVILSVPCCQHELNTQLADGTAHSDGRDILGPAFKYGIVRERMAALLTDALRAELLESCGYETQILEFIDMSHTPKNLLIRAIRKRETAGDQNAGNAREHTASESADKNEARDHVAREHTACEGQACDQVSNESADEHTAREDAGKQGAQIAAYRRLRDFLAVRPTLERELSPRE